MRCSVAEDRAGLAARRLAWELLVRIERDGAYANLVTRAGLGDRRGAALDDRDRAFVTALVHGAVRMRRACDAALDRFIASPPDLEIRCLLRLGAHQLVHLELPPHAVVDTTVELAPKRARGFVNAVLRRVADTSMVWPDLATELSYPQWIVDRLVGELGEADGHGALRAMNEAPAVTVRSDGYVQDLASQWVAGLVGAESGDTVFDVCAGPGGKATALAHTGATVVAADVHGARAALIGRNARRAGLSVCVLVADGRRPPFAADTFDRVLVDAPCSGLGALARRPDARWRIAQTDIDDLVLLQRHILESSLPLVRLGGRLVYSVCTLTDVESIDHLVHVDHAGFTVVPHDELATPGPWRAHGVGSRLLPQSAGTDGMTVVVLERRGYGA
jgi:16S rRNA (cytosine967-C5)-methyltransferase